jgi:hypothetical protein
MTDHVHRNAHIFSLPCQFEQDGVRFHEVPLGYPG